MRLAVAEARAVAAASETRAAAAEAAADLAAASAGNPSAAFLSRNPPKAQQTAPSPFIGLAGGGGDASALRTEAGRPPAGVSPRLRPPPPKRGAGASPPVGVQRVAGVPPPRLPPAGIVLVPKASGPPMQDPEMSHALTRLADCSEAQTAHLEELTLALRGRSSEDSADLGADPLSLRNPGYHKGAAYRAHYRALYRKYPGKYAALVREAILEVRSGDVSDADPRLESAWEYVLEHVPAENQLTLANFMLLAARAFDALRAGRWLEAEDDVARMLVAGEQAALDHGDWAMAWKLTFLADPPIRRMAWLPRRDSLRPHGALTYEGWAQACLTYLSDSRLREEEAVKYRRANPGIHGTAGDQTILAAAAKAPKAPKPPNPKPKPKPKPKAKAKGEAD